MTTYIAYTIFADLACTEVRQVVHAHGKDAETLLRTFTDLSNGCAPQEGETICGCRIDRIGSELQMAA